MAATSSMSELRLTFPKNDPRTPQFANLIHLLPECNVKCEVLQFAVIDGFFRGRIGAQENQAVLARTRNHSRGNGQMQFLFGLLCGDVKLQEDAAGSILQLTEIGGKTGRREEIKLEEKPFIGPDLNPSLVHRLISPASIRGLQQERLAIDFSDSPG